MEVGSLSGNRNLIVILLILLQIGASVYYYLQVYQPIVIKIEDRKQVMEKKRKDVREIELTKQLLEETKQEIERLKTDIARLEKFFPEDVFIPRVLVLIENLAIATHVDLDTIRPGKGGNVRRGGTSGGAVPAPAANAAKGKAAQANTPPTLKFDEAGEYKTSEVSLKVRGTFQNIYNFMNELATFPKLVVVDKMTLSGKGSGAEGESGSEVEGAPETGREVEVGGYVELTADIPLTFYVQKKDSPEFKY